MNRPFLRALAKRLGYSVYERSTHGPGRAWDWGPKDTMASNHFKSEEAAWRHLEETMNAKFCKAEALLKAAQDLMKEASW